MKYCAFGEAMIELSPSGIDWRMRFGGDVLNTAIHLARFGHEVSFISAVGDNDFCDRLLENWKSENIETSTVLKHPFRNIGLYAVENLEDGERVFTYWRDNSAIKDFFNLPNAEMVLDSALKSDVIGISLVSFAILGENDRKRLLDFCIKARANGAKILFDGNYRPKLWESTCAAIEWRDKAISICDFGLPTFDDENKLSKENSPAQVYDNWKSIGAGEVIVKNGKDGCYFDGKVIAPVKDIVPIDTSGAGDAFNAGYLNARVKGQDPFSSAKMGHELAAWVISKSGAIPEAILDTPYKKAATKAAAYY